MYAGFGSIARYTAWRNLRTMLRAPGVLVPTLLLPLLSFVAFVGALSGVTKLEGFPADIDYVGFQYVYALMQAATFTGAMAGTTMSDDFENGFMDRMMLAAPERAAIVLGYVLATLVRGVIAVAILTVVAFAFGMEASSSPLHLVALFALAALMCVVGTLWATGVAWRVRSNLAAPGIILPFFLLLFFAPVFLPLVLLTGWLHAVAVANPLTYVIEAGRGFVAGDPVDVLLAFGIAAGMVVIFIPWAVTGVRNAEAAGG